MLVALPGVNAQIPGDIASEELNLQRLYIEASQARILGANDKAAEIYKQILEQDKQNHAAAYEYSRVLYSLEQYRESLDQINLALRFEKTNVWYWLMKADVLEMLEDYAQAISTYDELIRLKPQEQYYYLHQVELLLRTNQPEQAVAVLNRLESENGIQADIIRKKVEILDVLRKPAEAVVELEKYLKYYPNNIEFLQLAALYSLDSGDAEGAASYYERILRIEPDNAAANLYAANKYKSSGDDIEYLRSILPLIQNSEINIDAKVTELIPYVQKYVAQPNEAYGDVLGDLIAELVANHPDEAKAHALYADFLYASGNLPAAVSEYEATLALDKGVFDVWEQLMYLKAEMYDMDGLIRTSEQALNVFPNQASIYYLRGLAYAYKKDEDSALDELQQALIMSGRNKELRFHVLHLLGQVNLDAGNTEKAYEAFDKALELNGNDVTLLAQYSNALLQSEGDLGKAENLAKQANDLTPGNPQIEHTLAMIAYARNDYKKAFSYIDLSIDHGGGDDPIILEHCGDILYSLEKVDEAVEYWQLSLEGGNDSEILKKKIAERRIIH